MRTQRIILPILALSALCAACSPSVPHHTLQEYLSTPGLAQQDLDACDKAMYAILQRGENADPGAALDRLQARCATADHARDILLAGGGVNLIGTPEPVPNPPPRFWHDSVAKVVKAGGNQDPRFEAEARWCKANALYRDVSDDAVSRGCEHAMLAWSNASY